ncbi:hypothetical protein [Olsenella uli]|uniref:hypothetical protein n=1 Tax=Olsenella uli TaxID=133926 RepID=UPI0012AB870E|nr:hypothetical protein [Olsenella uli]
MREGRLALSLPRKSAVAATPARRDRWRRVGDFLARLGLALALICLGAATLVATVSTVWLMTDAKEGNLTQSMSVFTLASPESWAVLGAGAAGGVVVLAVCWLAWRFGAALEGRRASAALVLAALVAQLVVVLALQTRDANWGDSWMVGGMADRAVAAGSVRSLFEGPYRTLFYDARLYFACYPFQATYFWLLWGLRQACGAYSYLVFQVISSVVTSLAAASLLDLGHTLAPSAGARRVLWVLVALCLPMYWLSTFLYCNAMGFGFAAAFLAMQARAMRAAGERGRAAHPSLRSLAWCAASLVPLALALCTKATFVLFALAAVLAWVVLAVRARDPRGLAACLAVVLAARSLSGLPFQALREASGGYEFGDALTTLNHLELGLRMGQGEFYVSVDGGEPTFAPGGWSNHANALWDASGQDAYVQDLAAQQLIAAHVVEFAGDPSYAARFFSVKLASEWADPTYQALYYLAECLDGAGERVCNPADLSTPVGLACTVLTFLLDGYQTLTLAAALGALAQVRRRWGIDHGCAGLGEEVALLLAATFFVGFGCYLLWEAKSVYLLPFACVLLPLSAAGLDAALAWLKARVARLVASRRP